MEIYGDGWLEQQDTKVTKYRCRRWIIRIRTNEGKKSKWFVGSISEAKKAKDAFIEELLELEGNAQTFGEYSHKWFKWRKESNSYSPNTLEKNERLNKGLNKYFEDIPLNKITSQYIKDTMVEFRGIGGEKVKNTYKRMFFSQLNAILDSAEKDEIIKKNPMSGVELPKNDTPEKKALSLEELNNLIKLLENEKMDGRVICTLFMCYLGFRRSECIGLFWEDISFKNGTVLIRRAYKNADGSIGVPKSKAGRRKLPIPKQFLNILKEWKRIVDKEAKNCFLVCPDTTYTVLNPTSLRKWFNRFCKRTNFSHITFHEIRHSHLTIVARNMNQFDLQRYAGWSSLEPAKIYIHEDYNSMKMSAKEIAKQLA